MKKIAIMSMILITALLTSCGPNEKTQITKSKNNLKQMVLQMQMYFVDGSEYNVPKRTNTLLNEGSVPSLFTHPNNDKEYATVNEAIESNDYIMVMIPGKEFSIYEGTGKAAFFENPKYAWSDGTVQAIGADGVAGRLTVEEAKKQMASLKKLRVINDEIDEYDKKEKSKPKSEPKPEPKAESKHNSLLHNEKLLTTDITNAALAKDFLDDWQWIIIEGKFGKEIHILGGLTKWEVKVDDIERNYKGEVESSFTYVIPKDTTFAVIYEVTNNSSYKLLKCEADNVTAINNSMVALKKMGFIKEYKPEVHETGVFGMDDSNDLAPIALQSIINSAK